MLEHAASAELCSASLQNKLVKVRLQNKADPPGTATALRAVVLRIASVADPEDDAKGHGAHIRAVSRV